MGTVGGNALRTKFQALFIALDHGARRAGADVLSRLAGG
jgi:hypothetical protein